MESRAEILARVPIYRQVYPLEKLVIAMICNSLSAIMRLVSQIILTCFLFAAQRNRRASDMAARVRQRLSSNGRRRKDIDG